MIRFLLFFFFSISFALSSDAQSKAAYIIYNKKGKAIKYKQFFKKIKKAEVLLFGELHNNALIHWLQLEVAKDLYNAKGNQLYLGAEMIESKDQNLLDAYLNDRMTTAAFEKEVDLWSNYATDYKPLVLFAKTNRIPFIASNIPRPFASLVFKQGIEQLAALSAQEKQYIAPLPITIDLTLSSYVKMMDMMGDHSEEGENFPKAQAVKDATMGYFITQNLKEDTYFCHFNGSFHSDNYEGIYWYIQHYRPNTIIKTITTVEQKDISKLEKEYIGTADFIICIPDTMTKTY